MNIYLIVSIILSFILLISFSGCFDEKSKFIGTWESSDGNTTMQFNNDNTVLISGTGPLGILTLIGTFDYTLTNEKITFSSNDVGLTLNYSFPNSSTLILSNDQGGSVVFTKI